MADQARGTPHDDEAQAAKESRAVGVENKAKGGRMTFNWPLFQNPLGFHMTEHCIMFCDEGDIPLLSRPRYLWFLDALPEAERRRKMERARKEK